MAPCHLNGQPSEGQAPSPTPIIKPLAPSSANARYSITSGINARFRRQCGESPTQKSRGYRG
ncbi:DUF1924 domain-containing protein [Thiothrix subterranea]|nr:DUF1924 domain-containing protein [Thiothrix subterranea]